MQIFERKWISNFSILNQGKIALEHQIKINDINIDKIKEDVFEAAFCELDKIEKAKAAIESASGITLGNSKSTPSSRF